ncbi:MAG: hypothetical protein RL018_1691 [Pseudomonadota bacterium]|jgi:hypothetical protein
MAKGISSKNSLKALAYPLQQFIGSWGVREKPSAPLADTHGQAALPAPYELAALRGEGILRLRFFSAFMDKVPVTLDADQQIAAWQALVEDGGHITAWVERLGVAKALRREAQIGAHANAQSRKLYAVLLDALQTQAPELLPWAVEGYFWHCWRQQFPSTAAGEDNNSNDTDVLRARLVRNLRKLHSNRVEIKESFTQSEEAVDFSVLWRKDQANPWQTLHHVNRPRLKTARLAAYAEAMRKSEDKPEIDKK